MSVLVDTSAFLAVLNADDTHHHKATTIWTRAIEKSELLYTHNYIVLETAAVLQNRFGMDAARVFFEDILPIVRVEWVRETDAAQGVQALLTANRRNLSLTDCVSFYIIRRLGLRKVFCFDRHFQEQGFEIV